MISIRNLKRTFKTKTSHVHAVDGVSLDIGANEFFVLLGLSGSGKTTLLRCVAGLEKPDGGDIRIGGVLVSSTESKFFVTPEERGIGMVFQSYAVWPHMTVFENVAFPLRNGPSRLNRGKIKERVMHALETVQLAGLADRPAPFLSGGQQQRVALARALAVEPRVLLMDEPLSNLDARLREEVRDEIKELAKKFGIAVLYVTHDQVEAMALADRIAVMSRGKVLQCAAPAELYENPTNQEVCEFLGSTNIIKGVINDPYHINTSLGVLACDREMTGSGEVTVAIRPEELRVAASASGLPNELTATVTAASFLGEISLCDLRAQGTKLRFKTTEGVAGLQPGQTVFVRFPPDRLKIFRD